MPEPVAEVPVPTPPPPVVEPSIPEPPRERRIVSHAEPVPQILLLLSSTAPSYTGVAASLERSLEDQYRLYAADLTSAGEREIALVTNLPSWSGVVAIGASAAEFARRRLGVPTVFCQIFDYEDLIQQDPTLFGVEALPPLELQLHSWLHVATDVKSVGLIVTEGDHALVESARAAAAAAGLELRHAFAKTDREAVYQFKRIAQAVDGILLYPSRDILSPGAIQEILDYSSKHGVHSIVFDESLLARGALLSVSSDADDVADTVAAVIEKVVSGNTEELAPVTPLTRAKVKLNPGMAGPLGVARASNGALSHPVRTHENRREPPGP